MVQCSLTTTPERFRSEKQLRQTFERKKRVFREKLTLDMFCWCSKLFPCRNSLHIEQLRKSNRFGLPTVRKKVDFKNENGLLGVHFLKNVPFPCQIFVHSAAFCPNGDMHPLRCAADAEGRQAGRVYVRRLVLHEKRVLAVLFSQNRCLGVVKQAYHWSHENGAHTGFPSIRLVTTFAERKRAKKCERSERTFTLLLYK